MLLKSIIAFPGNGAKMLVALIVFTIQAPHKLSTRGSLFIPKTITHWICSISKAKTML